jgi:hypothetical protein
MTETIRGFSQSLCEILHYYKHQMISSCIFLTVILELQVLQVGHYLELVTEHCNPFMSVFLSFDIHGSMHHDTILIK